MKYEERIENVAGAEFGAVRSMMGEEIDGIIGMDDILGSLPFTFNLKQNELYWRTPDGAVLTPLYGTYYDARWTHDGESQVWQ